LNYYGPNTFVDLNLNTGGKPTNIAPNGFDGSIVHTYRFVRESGKSLFYLFDDGIPLLLGELANGRGASWDNRNLMFGVPGGDNIYQFHYLRIASGAHIPQPVPAPGAVILGSIGLAFAGWKLRKREGL